MILAADFGGTTIKTAIISGGSVVRRRPLDARSDRPMAERLEVVAEVWEELLKSVGKTPRDCQGTALSLPFLIDPKRSRVLGDFAKFPGASEIDFADWSQKRLGLPTVLENDLRVALLGEWQHGAARNRQEVLMLALGTGIGCAAICRNQLLRGAHNRAASLLGHSTVDYRGPKGRCGNRGCAEDLASTAMLPEMARKHAAFPGSQLERASNIDFLTLFNLAASGDACSQALQQECLDVWSVVIQNAILAFDPELVVLGGGVLGSAAIILPAVRKYLQQHVPGIPFEIPLVCSELGDDAALIGGEVLFRQTYPLFNYENS